MSYDPNEIKRYIGIARQMARRMTSRFFHGVIDKENIEGEALIGLARAIERYDSTLTSNFELYAIQIIKNHVATAIRDSDYRSRVYRRRIARLDAVYRELGEYATEAEAAEETGMTIKQVRESQRLAAVHMVPVEDAFLIPDITVEMDDEFTVQVVVAMIRDILKTLPFKQRQAFVFYYRDGLTTREVGLKLKVTDSRISQLLLSACQSIKKKLKFRGVYNEFLSIYKSGHDFDFLTFEKWRFFDEK